MNHPAHRLRRSVGSRLRAAADVLSRRAGSQLLATVGTVLSALLIGWSCLAPPTLAAAVPPTTVSSAHR